MNSLKHIGILGLGSRSTLFYLKLLNAKYNAKHKSYSTFPCLIYNVDFNGINSCLPDQTLALTNILKPILKRITLLPIDHLLVPNITLHETLDTLSFNVPLIHPVALTVERLQKNNQNRVVLIGSRYTMNANYLVNVLNDKGFIVNVPTKTHQNLIDDLRKKVYHTTDSDYDLIVFKKLVAYYKKIGTLIICCTELSILHSKIYDNAIIDMAFLQIESAINL